MRPITVAVGPLASAATNNICTSQTPSGAGALTLNGVLVVAGVAVLDVARQVLLTFAGNETGHNFVVTGKNWAGDAISETVAGTNTNAATVLSYKSVSSITISAAAAGAITVGTNGVATSPWVRFDSWADGNISVQCTVSGTVSYTVQGSMDDPNSPTNAVTPINMTWVNFPDLNMVAQTATAQGNYQFFTPIWARILLNSGTGTVTGTFVQISSVNY